MKFLISNLKLLVRRFPSVVAINIVGLSVAFAVTFVVAKQVWYDLTYDRGFKNSKEIFTVETDWGSGGGPKSYMNRQIPELWMERVPEMKDYCLIGTDWGTTPFRRQTESPEQAPVSISFYRASKGFLDIFTPEIVEGDASSTLLAPGRCIIPASIAASLFGDGGAVGEVISSERTGDLVVDAVYRDFPANSSIANSLYTYLPEQDNPGMFGYRGYFTFPPADLDRVTERINDPALLAEADGGRYADYAFHLTRLPDYYLNGGATGQGGHGRTTLYLLVTGLFVLVVAAINFINLSMAMAPARVRNVNIHRILGIGRVGQKVSLAMESVIVSLLAVFAGGLIVRWFAGSAFIDFFTAPLSFGTGVGLTAAVVALFLAVAFAVGLYSARYASSFDVAIALKSSFVLSRRGTRLRNTLIVVQFATAIFFICFAAAVSMQYDYMSNYSIGYEKENIVVFDGGRAEVSADALAGELKRNSGVLDVTSSFDIPGAIGSFSGTNIKDKPVSYSYHTWVIAGNFLDFFGIEATQGRLDAGFNLYTQKGMFASTMIVNRELLRQYDFTETEMAEMGIGVTGDVNFESLHEPVKPMAFTIMPEWTNAYPKIFVKITGDDVPATLDHIEKTWKSLSGSSSGVNITFLDDELDKLYRRELNTSRLIGILGLVAVVIAIMGVYGLAAFNTRYKTKEIAIRKVNGATIGGIALMLNRGMLILIGVAFALAAPLALLFINRWIAGFAYKAAVPWWLFPIAGVLVLLIAVATVSWQSWRAASANPVNALKSE